MVYVRRRAYRRRRMPMRRRRKMPLKMGIKKKVSIVRSVNIKNDVHYFSRWAPFVDTNTLSTSASTQVASLFCSLADIPNYSEFTNLFDSYKIIGIQFTFRLMDNPDSNNYINSTLFTQGSNFYPKLWVVQDRDSQTSTTVAQIRERGHSRQYILKPDRFIKVFIKNPVELDAVYDGSSGSTYVPATPRDKHWLPTGQTGIRHYLLTVGLDKMGYAGNTCTVGIEKRYFLALKNSK